MKRIKSFGLLVGAIALVLALALSLAACGDDSTGGGGGGGGGSTLSINGVWKSTSSGNVMSIYDNKSVATEIVAANWKEAERMGNIGIGQLVYRNITSTGNSTWSGQAVVIENNYSVRWGGTVTLTLSANGQTLTTYQEGVNDPTGTWTRKQ